MKKMTYVVANAQGLYYTAAADDAWSPDESVAHKYVNPDEAKSFADFESAFVVPC